MVLAADGVDLEYESAAVEEACAGRRAFVEILVPFTCDYYASAASKPICRWISLFVAA